MGPYPCIARPATGGMLAAGTRPGDTVTAGDRLLPRDTSPPSCGPPPLLTAAPLPTPPPLTPSLLVIASSEAPDMPRKLVHGAVAGFVASAPLP